MVKKAVNTKAMISLQPLSTTKKNDSKCPKGYKPSAKQKKHKTSQKHRDKNKNKNKAKFHNSLSANTS